MMKKPPPPEPPPPRRIKNVPRIPKDNNMKEEKSKTEKFIGMLGFISIVVIIIGILIIIWTQPWIPIAKLVLTGCVGLTISMIYFRLLQARETQKLMDEMEEKRKNRKTFQERVAEIKERDN